MYGFPEHVLELDGERREIDRGLLRYGLDAHGQDQDVARPRQRGRSPAEHEGGGTTGDGALRHRIFYERPVASGDRASERTKT